MKPFFVELTYDPSRATDDEWLSGAEGVINTHPVCYVKDLSFTRNLEEDPARRGLFRDLTHLTPAQAVRHIVRRGKVRGILVEPGEATVNDDGSWTFSGFRLSRPSAPAEDPSLI